MKTKLLLLLVTLAVAGCHSYNVNSNWPVRYASGVQVTPYTSSPHSRLTTIEVFDNSSQVTRPYHRLARLSRGGHRSDKGRITNALIWRARQMGADAIILEPNNTRFYEGTTIIYDQSDGTILSAPQPSTTR